MSKMKMIMLVNSANESLCEFLPNDSPQKLISELHDVSIALKRIPSKGCIQTTQNKFVYKQYNPSRKNTKSKEEDVLVIFICTELKYKDKLISKFFDEVFNSLSLNSYSNYKLNTQVKKKIGNIFYKYQDENNINKENIIIERDNLEFGTLNDFTSLDIDSKRTNNSISIYGLIESMDEKDAKTLHKGDKGEIRVPLEISKVKKWKTLKCIFLFINIMLIALTIFLFYYFITQPEKE